jgi:hypothetical protein
MDYPSRAIWDAAREPWYAALIGQPMPPYGDNARRSSAWRVALKRHDRSIRRLEAWESERDEVSRLQASAQPGMDTMSEPAGYGLETLVTAASHAVRMKTTPLSALQSASTPPPPPPPLPPPHAPALTAASPTATAPNAAAPATAALTTAAPTQREPTSAAEVADLDGNERRKEEAAASEKAAEELIKMADEVFQKAVALAGWETQDRRYFRSHCELCPSKVARIMPIKAHAHSARP